MDVVRRAWQVYRENLKPGLVFVFLFLLLPVLALFAPATALASGTFFAEYGWPGALQAVALLALAAAALAVFSFALTLVVLGVRRSLSRVRHPRQVPELARVFVSKVFVFFALYSAGFYALSLALLAAGVPFPLAAGALFLLALPFLYVPQALVVEEASLAHGVEAGVRFALQNPRYVGVAVAVGAALLALAVLAGFLLNAVFLEALPGRYVAMLLVLAGVVPFVEALKTYQYMMRFDLIRRSERHTR